MRQQFAAYQTLIYAALILIVLFLLPNGTVGLVSKISALFKKQRQKQKTGKEKALQ